MRDAAAPIGGGENDDEEEEEDGGDSARVTVKAAVRTVLPTRWQTKVFAVACVRRIIQSCCENLGKTGGKDGRNPHIDLALARKQAAFGDYLVLRLNEIIRTCFIAATSTVDQLRQVGLEALEVVITTFASTKDLDLDGDHSILEQFQAQVTSALRPAFAEDVSPLVRFTACKVGFALAECGDVEW